MMSDNEVADFTQKLQCMFREVNEYTSVMEVYYWGLAEIYQILEEKLEGCKDHPFMETYVGHIKRMYVSRTPQIRQLVEKNSESQEYVKNLEQVIRSLENMAKIIE
jgi:hypothetical protein